MPTIKSTKEFIVSYEMKNCCSEQKAMAKDGFLKPHLLFPNPEDTPNPSLSRFCFSTHFNFLCVLCVLCGEKFFNDPVNLRPIFLI
jgi:hypothetical protein